MALGTSPSCLVKGPQSTAKFHFVYLLNIVPSKRVGGVGVFGEWSSGSGEKVFLLQGSAQA